MRLLTEHRDDGIERWLEWTPAWDKRNVEAAKNYGVHGVEIKFGVTRSGASVIWQLMTGWLLPHNREELKALGLGPKYYFDGLGDLGWHSPVALYSDENPVTSKCEYTGGVCYYDGTGLGAKDLFDKACADAETIWETLEERLRDLEQQIIAAREERQSP